jgi:hypothetical protein
MRPRAEFFFSKKAGCQLYVIQLPLLVIPAQAGIQRGASTPQNFSLVRRLDASFRWHDNRALVMQWSQDIIVPI